MRDKKYIENEINDCKEKIASKKVLESAKKFYRVKLKKAEKELKEFEAKQKTKNEGYLIAGRFLFENYGEEHEGYGVDNDPDDPFFDDEDESTDETSGHVFKFEAKGTSGKQEVSVNPYPGGDLELRLYKPEGEKGNNHCRIMIPKEKVEEFINFFNKQVQK